MPLESWFGGGKQEAREEKPKAMFDSAVMRRLALAVTLLAGCDQAGGEHEPGAFEPPSGPVIGEMVPHETPRPMPPPAPEPTPMPAPAPLSMPAPPSPEPEKPAVPEKPAESPERVDRKKPYLEMFETYPNLAPIKKRLEALGVHGPLMELFADGFDPTMDTDKLKALVGARFPPDAKGTAFQRGAYALTVAQGLWVEKHGGLPWSIKELSPELVEQMFHVMQKSPDGIGTGPRTEVPGFRPKTGFVGPDGQEYGSDEWRLDVEREASYLLFPVAKDLLGKTRQETARNIVRWTKANFFHAYQDSDGSSWGWDRYADGQTVAENGGSQIFLQKSLARYFDERISGCHDTANIIVKNLLRALNVPAIDATVEAHGVVLLSEEKLVVHGDTLSSQNMIQTENHLLPYAFYAVKHGPESSIYYAMEEAQNRQKANHPDKRWGWIPASTNLGRSPEGLILNTAIDVIPPNILDDMRREMPAFEIPGPTRKIGNSYRIETKPVPIRTLSSLRGGK